jgi:uncharacterized protein
MTKIPKEVMNSIKKADVFVLGTSTKDGKPNVIYVAYLKAIDDENIIIADNKMVKTLDNVLANPQMAFTFRDDEAGSYQIKGHIEYHTDDAYHDEVKTWCKQHLSRKGAIVLHIDEVYNGSKKLA